MKVKRINLQIEVPMRTVKTDEIHRLVRAFLAEKEIPFQTQIAYELSPNTRIGRYTSYEPPKPPQVDWSKRPEHGWGDDIPF